MSLAGVRSSRGDGYQVAVAVQETLLFLGDDGLDWLEIDSTSPISNGKATPVDDVVLSYSNGSIVFCQCKKNQPKYAPWTIKDLQDELAKAGELLATEPNASVRFYSRGDFGNVMRLIERARILGNEVVFRQGVPEELVTPLEHLASILDAYVKACGSTLCAFLLRVRCTPTGEVEDIQRVVKERLRFLVTRVEDAFNTLWTTLDNLGAHVEVGNPTASEFRLTRSRVVELLQSAGCAITPPKALVEIETAFKVISAVGRQWQRDVDGEVFDRSAVDELLRAVAEKQRTVLLVDGAGAGKTCVLLALMEHLEQDPSVAPLFIQAREFSRADNSDERTAMGLPANLFELVSAMSEQRQVVVAIDSLDVLSLARDSENLAWFLSLVDRLAMVPSTTIIAACRSFDVRYNRKLSVRKWGKQIAVGLLDWEADVQPSLQRWGVDPGTVDTTTRELLRNPRNLALASSIVKRGELQNANSAQALTEAYLDAVVSHDPALGATAESAIAEMATEMLRTRSLSVPRGKVHLQDDELERLRSANILIGTNRGQFGFGHQTLLDALAVRDASSNGKSLLQFIEELPAVPFVRPAIRAFFTYLRFSDRRGFRSQLRAVFSSGVAFHIKRLLAESMAEMAPEDADAPLVNALYTEHDPHFRSLYGAAESGAWYQFWKSRYVPRWVSEGNMEWLTIHVRRVTRWMGVDKQGVLDLWTQAAQGGWFKDVSLRNVLGLELNRLQQPDWPALLPLFRDLLKLQATQHDFLADAIRRCVEETGQGEDLLWECVAGGITAEDVNSHRFEEAVRLSSFHGEDFFRNRVLSSDGLVSSIVESVESWSSMLERGGSSTSGQWNDHFVDNTSYELVHSRHTLHHSTSADQLFGTLEQAVLARASSQSRWWQQNARRLCLSACGALRYIGMLALTKNPSDNEVVLRELFKDERLYEQTDPYELGNLIHAAAHLVRDDLDDIERGISQRHSDYPAEYSIWLARERAELYDAIPAHLRSEAAQDALGQYLLSHDPIVRAPRIRSRSGMLAPPFSVEELRAVQGKELLRLLQAAESLDWSRTSFDDFVGGFMQVLSQLELASSLQPVKSLQFLVAFWDELSSGLRSSIFSGVARCLQYRKGVLQPAENWKPEEADCDELGLALLEELERHSAAWEGTRAGAEALEACAHALARNDPAADRVAFVAVGFARQGELQESAQVPDDDLVSQGYSHIRVRVAEALMILANDRVEHGLALPELVVPQLLSLARDANPSVPAMILSRLAYLQHRAEAGWALLEACLSGNDERLWPYAESCLYCSYRNHFDRVAPLLSRMDQASHPKALETWGRISALASLSCSIACTTLLENLKQKESKEAWNGAASVWAANASTLEHRAACLRGLEKALDDKVGAVGALRAMSRLWRDEKHRLDIPVSVVKRVVERAETLCEPMSVHGIERWCAAMVDVNPNLALEAAEAVAASMRPNTLSFGALDSLPALLTSLFQEAEEREESDGGEMLNRVVRLQDRFLAASPDAMNDWMRSAERPGA